MSIDPNEAMMVDGELIQVTDVTLRHAPIQGDYIGEPGHTPEERNWTFGVRYGRTPEDIERPHVSVSAMQEFLKCRQAWKFSSSRGYNLQPVIPNKHLLLGSAIHEALAAYYLRQKHTAEECVSMGIPHIQAAYDAVWDQALYDVENSLLGEMPESVLQYNALGRNMLEQYERWAPENDDFEVIAVEHKMVVPVHHFDFVGVLDMLIKDKDGCYWVLDHKTLGRVPEYRELLFSLQASAYMWAARKVFDVPISGVMFNILVKTEVKSPSILKSGAISQNVRQATTRELVEQEIVRLGFDRKDYAEFIGKLGENKYNVRIPVVPTDGMLAWWERTLESVGTHMLGNPMITPSVAKNCSWCSFGTLCERIRNGMRWQPIAKVDYMERKEYVGEDADAASD